MKHILLIAINFFFLSPEKLHAQKDFAKLLPAADSSFGYTAENPVKLKKGNQEKSIENTHKFLGGLKTTDNQTLILLARSSVRNPGYKKPVIQITDRTTGMPLSGKLAMLDKCIFITSNTKDTVTLYVDIYNKGELFLPVGLKYD